jgi:hypothetical protein
MNRYNSLVCTRKGRIYQASLELIIDSGDHGIGSADSHEQTNSLYGNDQNHVARGASAQQSDISTGLF